MKRMTMLEITREGKIIERHPENDSEGLLDGTLLHTLYPDIHVALVSLPQGSLDIREESMFSGKFDNIEHNGVRYQLIGGSGSVKKRKYYFVDEAHRDPIADRFGRWPEALITYFGILVSSVQEASSRKTMSEWSSSPIERSAPTTAGDGSARGCSTGSTFSRAGSINSVWPSATPRPRERSRSWTMTSPIFSAPTSSFRKAPSSLRPPRPYRSLDVHFQADIVPGVREVSRLLAFESSYTLIVHAPRESVEQEIIPKPESASASLNAAFSARNHPALVELLGRRVPDDVDEEEEEKTPERTVEAVLLADGSGELTRHPYIHQQLNKMLTHWAYKTLTGGGLELPAFALADDGYLFLDQGRICAGSDWLPLDTAITSVSAPYGLCVRHPIRMREDLLPLLHLHADEVADKLIEREGIDSVMAHRIARDQICLQGVYVLNSETAKRNGGDFDFDYVCVVDGDKYPRFVACTLQSERKAADRKGQKGESTFPVVQLRGYRHRGRRKQDRTHHQSESLLRGGGPRRSRVRARQASYRKRSTPLNGEYMPTPNVSRRFRKKCRWRHGSNSRMWIRSAIFPMNLRCFPRT